MPDQNPEGNLVQGELPPKNQEAAQKEGVVLITPEPTVVAKPRVRSVIDLDDTSITNWNIQR